MLTNFVAGTLDQFIAKYTYRSQALESYAPTIKPVAESAESEAAAPAADRVEVSPEAQALANQQNDLTGVEDAQQPDETTGQTGQADDAAGGDSSEADDDAVQPGTTPVTHQVRAEAEIRIRMAFSLRSISSAIQRLESGELNESEAMNVVQSALSVRMKAQGYSVTRTDGVQSDTQGLASAKLKFRQRAMAHYGAKGDNSQMHGFYREAFKLRQSMHTEQQGTHQRVINRFAMRYRFDARFSVQHLERFNSSSEAVAKAHPQAMSGFLNASDQVAAGGSLDTVATFFDTVEAFVDGAEDQLLEKVGMFVEAASAQMGGVSSELALLLEDQITTRVESFFDRVSDALSQLEATYLPESGAQPVIAADESQIQPGEITPTVANEGKATLAVA